ncbi:coenzyme F420-0:L-glutamate ligase [Blastococcus colisei]|nr:coenzyme F420-0:L-glutamate ligase [Blastococcus colisei]
MAEEGPRPAHPSQAQGGARDGAVPSGVSILPVHGLPEFAPDDDLAAAIAGAAPWLADGDVVVVTSKAVSKVEGRLLHVPPGADREAVRLQAVEDEAVRVVARRGPLAIVQTRQGWVVAAAGIDASNVRQDVLVLLPEDADASARRLRDRLRELLGVGVAVVVSDTFGRTWREGLTDVAVGSAGIAALTDHRGAVDAWGNRLETTRVAVVDELASAADLVKGKLAGVPVAVVRGLPPAPAGEDDPGTRPLVRLPADDLFPYGARDLVRAREPGAELVPRAGELSAAASAFRVASAALPEFPVVLRHGGEGDGVIDVHLTDTPNLTTALNLGALLGAAIVQLHAEGWATRWEPVGTPGGSSLVGRLWLGTLPAVL